MGFYSTELFDLKLENVEKWSVSTDANAFEEDRRPVSIWLMPLGQGV